MKQNRTRITWQTALNGRSTLGELMDEWLKREKNRCKASTYAAYSQRAERHLRPVLGDIRLKKLNETDYRRLYLSLESLAPATRSGVLCVLRLILEYGRSFGLAIAPEAELPHEKPENRAVSVLNADELRALEETLGRDDSLRSLGLRLCLYTGLRLGEVCALRWGDIDPDGRLLHISRTVQRLRNESGTSPRTVLRLDTPKSCSSARSVPIPSGLAAELRLRRTEDDCYLLTGCPERFMDPRTYQLYFRRTLEKAGIRTVNFHMLRHTFATRCVDLGLDAKSLSQALGHADVRTTLNIYVHPDEKLIRDCQERMMLASAASRQK